MATTTRTWAEPVAGPDGDPQLGCDLPLDLRPVLAHNELFVSGWAVASSKIASVEVELGGRTMLASYGHPSPWLEDAFPGQAFARYELTVDTARLDRGKHTLHLRATSTDGRQAEMTGTVECEPYEPTLWQREEQAAAIEAGRPVMWCDSPNIYAEDELGGPVAVRGWAHAAKGIEQVSVFVDGERHEAMTGRKRPDLRARWGEEVARESGFLFTLTGAGALPGRHELVLIAYPREGMPVGMSGHVQITETKDEWTAQAVDRDELLAASGERYVPARYAGTSVEIEHHARYRWAAQLAADKDVLDAGCGAGWGSAMVARGGAAAVTGLDLNEAAIGHAREHYGEHAEFVVGDLCAPPLPDCSFDLVVCFEAIEHVEDTSSALDHLRRMLRPDGVLLISTPLAGVYPAGNPFHVHEFAFGELEAALERRFENVSAFRQETFAASLLAEDVVMAVKNPSNQLGLDVRKMFPVAPGEATFTVVAASDGELPQAPHMVVLGDASNFRLLLDEVDSALDQVEEARGKLEFTEVRLGFANAVVEDLESENAKLKQKLTELEACAARKEERMTNVLESKSWRWTTPLRDGAQTLRSYIAQRKNP